MCRCVHGLACLPTPEATFNPLLPPPEHGAPVPPTDAQTRMELHAGLDIILGRAPQGYRERIAQDITHGAGQYGNFPLSTPKESRAPQDKRLMRLLATTIGSGDPEAIQAVTKTLEVFARHVTTPAAIQEPKPSAAASGRVNPSEAGKPGTPVRKPRSRAPWRED